MKRNFDFTLSGKKFLPLFILIYLFVGVPYIFSAIQLNKMGDDITSYLPFAGVYLSLFAAMILYYFIIRLFIKHTLLDNEAFTFDGTFGKFIGKLLLGLLLSIVTVSIYMPWFIRDMMKYFAQNTQYKGKSLDFNGKGWRLLIIMLCIIIPAFLFGMITAMRPELLEGSPIVSSIVAMTVFLLILIPYYYFVYRWMVDFAYDEKEIKWNTKFGPSVGKLFLEIFLSIITVGIYMPAAYLKLFKYFVDRTVTYDEENKIVKRFSFELETIPDFLFLWGQTLLCIVTLGIYYPWAICNIATKFSQRTAIEDVEE